MDEHGGGQACPGESVLTDQNWGGKRKGAGRPRAAYVRLKDVTIPREVWDALEQQAQRKGVTPAELAAHVLEDYATAPLFAKI